MIAEDSVIIIEFIHRIRLILSIRLQTDANLWFLFKVFVHLKQFPGGNNIHVQYIKRKETARDNAHLYFIPKIRVINFPHSVRED